MTERGEFGLTSHELEGLGLLGLLGVVLRNGTHFGDVSASIEVHERFK